MASPSSSSSFIWNFFEPSPDDDTYANCLLCKSRIKRGKDKKTFSTSPLMKHVQARHREDFVKAQQAAVLAKDQKDMEDRPPPLKKQKMSAMLNAHYSQIKLPEAFTPHKIWDINDPQVKAINRKVMGMIALDNQPFTIVEDRGFIDLMAHMQPKYCLPSRRYFCETMLPQVYEENRAKAFDLIKNAESLSFTSDIWTSNTSNESFVSLSSHWIDENFTRHSLVLNAKHFPQSHTGQNICQMFEDMFDNWKIEESRRHCLVRDGAANISLGSNMVGMESIHCFIHRLQLVIHDAIFSQRTVKDMLAKTRRIVTHFNHSSLACTELKELQKQEEGNDRNTVVLPVQDVSTRWNSTYLMCDRAVQLKRPLQLYLAEHDQLPKLSANEWGQMEKLLLLLKPFFELTKQLSSENASISRVIPDVQMLDALLAKEGDDRGVQTTKQELREALTKRFKQNDANDKDSILNQKLAALATTVDPRFKQVFFPKATKVSVKAQLLDELYKQVPRSTSSDDTPSGTGSSSSPAQSAKDKEDEAGDVWSSVFNSFAKAAEQEEEAKKQDSKGDEFIAVMKETEEYLGNPLQNRTANPLDWWRDHAAQFPHLATLARKFLATPASSVYSERLFSEYGNIFEEKRARLLPTTGEKLLFLHHNWKKLE